jgi:chromosomal replication initiation ATPase DnaA
MVYNDSRFEEIWNTVLVRLENDINDKTVFSTYFQDTKILSIEGDLVTILTNSAFGKEVLNRKFLEKIQDFLCDVTQSNFKCQIIDQTGLNGLKKNGYAASVSTPAGMPLLPTSTPAILLKILW